MNYTRRTLHVHCTMYINRKKKNAEKETFAVENFKKTAKHDWKNKISRTRKSILEIELQPDFHSFPFFHVVNIIFFIQFEGFIWNQTSLLLLRTISFWEIFAQSNFPHFKFPFSIRKPHQTERKIKWIPKNLYLAWRDDLI